MQSLEKCGAVFAGFDRADALTFHLM